NYLMARATLFADIVRHLTPFFVSRQVVCGAGRVGLGADGRNEGFQISQRADFFEVEVGLETTLKRPIINARDEPHADPEKYRRLHVIIGDANMSEVSTYLKLGTTSLVLAMIEDKFLDSDLALDAPVAELRAISHDPSCRHLVALRDGRRMTGVQLQMEYLERARGRRAARARGGAGGRRTRGGQAARGGGGAPRARGGPGGGGGDRGRARRGGGGGGPRWGGGVGGPPPAPPGGPPPPPRRPPG